jgi:ubiquinone/menaquinone biosynthesis C-methylase UbiE
MPLSAQDWHRRFEIQSQWTRGTRDYIFQRAGILTAANVLDVGCGTGVLSKELTQSPIHNVVGIDINPEYIGFAASIAPAVNLFIADAHNMPFKMGGFECSLCHYLLMWVEDPLAVLADMKRVTMPGGVVLVLAEPDYGGRIDYPEPLSILNEWQTTALLNQGANPFMGRKLKALFHQAGLTDIEVGVIGAQWKGDIAQDVLDSEWEIIRSDIESLKNKPEIETTSDEIQKIDLAAWVMGERVIYVPTFYAWGRVV